MLQRNPGEPNLEKIKEILLEPQWGEVQKRLARVENQIASMDFKGGGNLKGDVDSLRNDMESLATELQDVKNVLVALNKKITGAFSAFVKSSG